MKSSQEITAWVSSPWKRALDLALVALAAPILLPIALLTALLARASMGPPTIFVQERVGRHGRTFRLLKLRTMSAGSEGLPITGAGDPRVTDAGRWLRRTKCDEIPQVINVIRGEMSIVGPRPELPRYVALYTADQRRVLEARPGLTDPATLAFRNEEEALGSVPAQERETYYQERILPHKLRLNREYLTSATARGDLMLILKTLTAILWRPR
jgi:lipopolysaccharide/colanic/teichoic acid biosynthesis glycosyltransferase